MMADTQNHQETIYIFVDNSQVAETTSDSSSHTDWDHVTARVIIHVRQGQHVMVKKYAGHLGNFYGQMYLTFCGVLVKAD